MNQLNSVLLEGNLTEDPKKIEISNGTLVKFTIASNRYYRDKNNESKTETLFIPVQCWGTFGETIMPHVQKGSAVRVVGRLRLSKWTSKDGSPRESIEIVAQHLEVSNKNKKDVVTIEENGDDEPLIEE